MALISCTKDACLWNKSQHWGRCLLPCLLQRAAGGRPTLTSHCLAYMCTCLKMTFKVLGLWILNKQLAFTEK